MTNNKNPFHLLFSWYATHVIRMYKVFVLIKNIHVEGVAVFYKQGFGSTGGEGERKGLQGGGGKEIVVIFYAFFTLFSCQIFVHFPPPFASSFENLQKSRRQSDGSEVDGGSFLRHDLNSGNFSFTSL